MRQAEEDVINACQQNYTAQVVQTVQCDVAKRLGIAGWVREAANLGAQPVDTSEQSLKGLC